VITKFDWIAPFSLTFQAEIPHGTTSQICSFEIGFNEPRLPEARPAEVRPAEVRPVEVRLAEVRPAGVYLRVHMHTPPPIPDFDSPV